MQDNDKEPTMSDISGRLFEMPYATWDPALSCWRTYAGISALGSPKSSATWPTSGSMRNGACFEHPTWAHPTNGPDSLSLLGTPAARDHKDTGNEATAAFIQDQPHRSVLPRMIAQLLPTPAAKDGERGPDYAAATRPGTGGDSLTTTIAKLNGGRTPLPFPDGPP
jgi:hypothetical protein